MRAVDTNVLVRLMTRDDAKQVAAAEAFVANGAWVPHLALAEATWVLASVYECAPHAIVTAIEMLVNHQNLTLQDACPNDTAEHLRIAYDPPAIAITRNALGRDGPANPAFRPRCVTF